MHIANIYIQIKAKELDLSVLKPLSGSSKL